MPDRLVFTDGKVTSVQFGENFAWVHVRPEGVNLGNEFTVELPNGEAERWRARVGKKVRIYAEDL